MVIGGAASACAPPLASSPPKPPPTPREHTKPPPATKPGKSAAPATNIADALKVPRREVSLPGRYPARVVRVDHPGCVVSGKRDPDQAARMVERGMLALTGAPSIEKAWLKFVSPRDVIGLKVNPIGGKILSTSPEVVAAVIAQLRAAGIPAASIVIWDRREQQLAEAGFTPERFPGITIKGTEHSGKNGTPYDPSGKLYALRRVDPDVFFWADCEQAYDRATMPFMVNTGKRSFFSRIVTREVTKIINLPVLKNAGPTVTLCLKNLAYGSITNTARLHRPLWSETSAQVPCFAPLRDKVVLNIADGMIGCYQGGPAANPEFITDYKVMLFGTDPVAVDRVGYEIVLKKRIEEEIQRAESPKGVRFLEMAARNGLGVADPSALKRKIIALK